jgi:hypothetical protein
MQDNAPVNQDENPNSPALKAFCKRNGISATTAYKLARDMKLRICKILGKAIVTPAEEAEFLQGLPEYQPVAPGDRRRLPPAERKRAAA